MPSSTRLTIPRPCSQPWQAMTPDQQGRFCTHCQKTVVDFTAMTNAQVLAHLQQASGSSCGRFRPDQLNRTLTPSTVEKPGRWQWLSLLLSGWLSSQAVHVQSGNEPKGVAVVHTDTSSAVKVATESVKRSTRITIEGCVVDIKDNQPIEHVTITVNHTNYGTLTDTTGAFRLTLPFAASDSTIQLSAVFIGYVSQKKIVPLSALDQPLQFELWEDPNILTGEVVCVSRKPTLWRRIRNWFRRG